MKLSVFLVGTTVLACSLSAYADSYQYSFNGGGLSASGTLITAGNASTNFSLVTGFTGSQNGSAITLLAVNAFAGNDNLFKDAAPFYDFSGLSYSVAGIDYNIYSNSAGQGYVCTSCNGGQADGVNVAFTVTPISATPEPSSLALLGTGLLGVIGIVRKRFA